MINQSSSGHMMWINTRAMEAFDINEEAVAQWGTECIHVDENGKPNGLLAKKLPSYSDDCIRNIDQAITRHEALKTLTSNVAYMWHEEDRMGSISLGKLANFVVLDRDFMHDDFADIEKAICLATIVDGDVVYKVDSSLEKVNA